MENNLINQLSLLFGAVLLILLVYWVGNQWINNVFSHKKRLLKLKIDSDSDSTMLPIRMQAIERLLLLLERIQPEGLISRLGATETKVAGLQLALLTQIRSEFDHNMAQQLYVSDDCWQALLAARDEVLGLIHQASLASTPDAPAIQFSRLVLAQLQKQALPAWQQARQILKLELQKLKSGNGY